MNGLFICFKLILLFRLNSNDFIFFFYSNSIRKFWFSFVFSMFVYFFGLLFLVVVLFVIDRLLFLLVIFGSGFGLFSCYFSFVWKLCFGNFVMMVLEGGCVNGLC